MLPFLLATVISTAAQTTAITNVTVIDATGASARPHQTVVIRNGRIAEIGAKVRIPKGATRIVGAGKFLIPGLWDMHTHVAGISADPKWGKSLLPIYFAHGVVGVRDMAGDLDALLAWKREQVEGKLIGPRMIVSGPFLDGSAKGYGFPTDVIEVTTPETARKKVRELKKRGVDFIKVGSQLTPEVFNAIAQEAKAQGLTFVGHVPDSVKVEDAAYAGMRSMEHMYGMLWAVSGNAAELEKRANEAREKKDREGIAKLQDELEASFSAEKAATTAALFKQHGTWLVPTLSWTLNASTMDKVEANGMLAMLPKKLQAEWEPEKARKIFSPRGIAFYSRKIKDDMRLLKVMYDLGVPVLAGSDSLDPYVFPGDSLWKELAALNQAGLTPIQALQTATLNPAKFMGRDKDAGTIEKGKIADLVLLENDPLADLSKRPLITGVMQNGKYYSRAELQKLVMNATTEMNK
jgi:imidazolonepropionase-like amidohydrolase